MLPYTVLFSVPRSATALLTSPPHAARPSAPRALRMPSGSIGQRVSLPASPSSLGHAPIPPDSSISKSTPIWNSNTPAGVYRTRTYKGRRQRRHRGCCYEPTPQNRACTCRRPCTCKADSGFWHAPACKNWSNFPHRNRSCGHRSCRQTCPRSTFVGMRSGRS